MGSVLDTVGKKLRQIRKSKGFTQESLAEKCGFTFSYIGGVERAEKNISLLNLEKIADALEVDIYEFFVFVPELEKLAEKEENIKDIITWLLHKNKDDIRKARNVLDAVFNERLD